MEKFKYANYAIFKSGSKKEPSNYRPVSLSSHVGKILESIIKENITEFLNKNTL